MTDHADWRKIGALAGMAGAILGVIAVLPAYDVAWAANGAQLANVAQPATPADTSLAQFMIGRWAPPGLCDQPLEFKADGTIGDPPGGTWSLNGNALTMALGGEQPLTGRVVRSGNNLIITAPGGGEQRTVGRCP